jgi:hypothetical protein
VNYFIYPYAEFAGKSVQGLQTHFSFRDIPASVPMAAR